MIETLKENFSATESENFEPPPDFCSECLSEKFWRAHQSGIWRCFECEPPPNRSLVADEFDHQRARETEATRKATAIKPQPTAGDRQSTGVRVERSRTTWQSPLPVCEACRGQRYVEIDFGDGVVECRCWTCKHPTNGEPKPHLAPEVKRRGLTIRRGFGPK